MTGTIAEKIIGRAAGVAKVTPGDIVDVEVDMAMVHDSGGPRRFWDTLEELGASVWDSDRLVVVSDHFVPAKDVTSARILQITRDFATTFGVTRFHEAEGISHTIMIEKGYLQPGMLFVGGDSHSVTAGAMGCLAVGMGSTDMLGIIATGRTWLRVPETTRVELSSPLSPGVAAKDFILTVIGDHSMAGGRYRSMEYVGAGVEYMTIEERSVLTNMSAEIGAKAGIVPADATTRAYVEALGLEMADPVNSDADANFAEQWTYRGRDIVPVVALPHRHDDVVAAHTVDAAITRAYVGACTGAKYEDLVMAAAVLEGRQVSPEVLLQVAPASRRALQRATSDGTLAILLEAGAHILSTGCGACPGIGSGILGPGEVCISTTSRNVRGRMGSPESEVYLASPYAVAAAAVAGKVVDPREMMEVTECTS